jgi:hypothetical protein
MRPGLLLSLLFVGLTAAGCGAGQGRDSSADIMSDPSWTPPGQGDLAIGDDPEPKSKPKPKKARHLQQPNHHETPKNPLHARNP